MSDNGLFNTQNLVRVGRVDRQVVAFRDPAGPVAEHLRTIAMRLLVGPRAQDARAFAVISPMSGDGRSTVAANLAVVFAQAGRRTALIDGDLRSPNLHRLFHCDTGPGVTEFHRRDDGVATERPIEDVPGLYLITAGRATNGSFDASALAPERFGQMINQLRTRVDQIVIDTPAALRFADGPAIAAQAGAAVLVVRRGHTGISRANRLAADVHAMGATLLGSVLNDG